MSCYAIWNELNTWNIVLYMIMVWSNVEFDPVVLWPSQSICSVYNTKPIWYVLCDNLNEKCRRVEVYHSQGINTKSGYILCNRKILLVITVVNGNLLTTIAEPAIRCQTPGAPTGYVELRNAPYWLTKLCIECKTLTIRL